MNFVQIASQTIISVDMVRVENPFVGHRDLNPVHLGHVVHLGHGFI